MKICAIYIITNAVNGRQYVGSSVDVQGRWRTHARTLDNGTHHNRKLLRAWEKDGASCFQFEVLETVPEPNLLISREQFYMDTLKPWYNVAPRADSSLGVKRSSETRAKISQAKTGVTHTEETRRKMSETHRRSDLREASRRQGAENMKSMTPQARAENLKKAQAARAKTFYQVSEETRHKLSEALKGRTPSDRCLAAAAEHNRSRIRSDEARANISEALKGRTFSEETRAKFSAAKAGRKLSEEHRLKIAQGMTGRKRGPYKKRDTETPCPTLPGPAHSYFIPPSI